MKSQNLLLLIILIVILNSCASKPKVIISSSFKTRRAKIAILPFSSIGKDDIDFNESDKLTPYCIEMGFIVVERTKLQQVFEELNLELKGVLSKNNMNKVGKILGVDMIIFGAREYSREEEEFVLKSQSIRFVDVATGEVLISSYYRPNDKGEDITRQMALAIKERIMLYVDLKEGR